MSPNSKRLLIIWLILMLVIIVTGVAVYNIYFTYGEGYKSVKVQRYVGFSGKPKTMPLLGLEKFLKKMGMESELISRISQFENLPKTSDTIIINAPPVIIGHEKIASILDWVDDGGHLIYSASAGHLYDDDEEVDDEILQYLDVKLRIAKTKKKKNLFSFFSQPIDDDTKDTADVDSPAQCVNKATRGKVIAFPGTENEQTIQFNPRYSLQSDGYGSTIELSNANGVYLLQFPIGNGIITVMSDAEFIKNRHIIKYDHAQFFYQLVSNKIGERSRLKPSKVWIQYMVGMPNIINLIWMKGWMFVVALALLVVSFLLMKGRRFGPIITTTTTVRRSLMEHVNAVGMFLWKKNGAKYLLINARQKVVALAEKNHPMFNVMQPNEQYQILSEISGINEEKISYALTTSADDIGKDIREFTSIVILLNKLSRKLS